MARGVRHQRRRRDRLGVVGRWRDVARLDTHSSSSRRLASGRRTCARHSANYRRRRRTLHRLLYRIRAGAGLDAAAPRRGTRNLRHWICRGPGQTLSGSHGPAGIIRWMSWCARRLFGAALLLAAAVASMQKSPTEAALADLSGRAVPLVASAGSRGSVFVFIRTDCPISDRYVPELERQQQRAAAAHVEFALVFVDPAEPSDAIRAHIQTFHYTGRVLRDDSHALVRLAGVATTPEAAAFAHEPWPRAASRVSRPDHNRYVDFGRMRPAATDHDLADVIDAFAAGGRLTFRTTKAIGCVIADLR